MKILYVTTLVETIEAFLIPHIKMLLEEGHSVDCACKINKDIDDDFLKNNLNFYNIDFDRNPKNINYRKVINQIRELQDCKNYDIVHVHTPIASFLTRFALRKYNCKIIYTAHGFHFYKKSSLLSWAIYYPLEKMAAKWTDSIITINQEDYDNAKKFTFKGSSCDSVHLVHGVGVDLDDYKIVDKKSINTKRNELGFSKEDFVIIMIAEINKNKNQIQLVKAMELLKDKNPNIKAIIVGDGPMKEEILKEINDRNLEDNIKVLGYRTDINELINISDIGVLFSYREGLPRNIMELMANNKNIVATNIRGCRDLVCNDSIGTLVSLGDIEGTAKSIEKYYLNSLDKNYRVNNKNDFSKFIKAYELSNVLNELKKIYFDII